MLRSVQVGKVDLPADYRRGMNGLLAEELATEKMRYTLELKDKRVKEMALDGEAEKVRREKAAEAAGREQIIAAKAQEEAMKHVLPFKQRQIEQRKLEAEADKQSRIRVAEGSAQARRVEAGGEADARQSSPTPRPTASSASARCNAEQMAREGALVTQHPLLIQKTLADKLSDKIQVIIAPPPADGGFIGGTLLGDAGKSEMTPRRNIVRPSILRLALFAAAAAPVSRRGCGQCDRPAGPAALRAAPHESAQQQALLWQGELVEVRGERMDYLQVYDYRRERGGFVRASQVRRTSLAAAEAPELLAVVRFLRATPGAEALGIGLVAAYLQAAPADVLNGEEGVEALDALGTFADRLARRASSGAVRTKAADAALSAQLEVAARYGIKFTSIRAGGRMHVCYDGDAFRRVLAMRSEPEQRARAALALTRRECMDPRPATQRTLRADEWRAEVLDKVDVAACPPISATAC